MKEELGYAVKIERLVAINQNFFRGIEGRSYHELAFYYVVSAVDETKINKNDYIRDELDKGKIQHLEFKWVSLDQLKLMNFRPKIVVDCLNNDLPKIHITRQ